MERGAVNGAMYGLMLAALFGTADAIASRPLSILLWSGQAATMAIGALLTWRRMAMRWMIAMTLAAIQRRWSPQFTLRAGLLQSQPSVAVRVLSTLVAMLTLVLLSQWREEQKWRHWRLRTAHIRFRDICLFRHIPDLRSGRT